jgi:chemotaxis protein methyltransferase CheR
MKDSDCVRFLQWALPRLQMRWPGFRKVRRQVCRRVQERLRELGMTAPGEYREYLERHPGEWAVLDRLMPVTISSFYRDRAVWDFLRDEVLPFLGNDGRRKPRAWSIGCASGEEPYTLLLAWRLGNEPCRPLIAPDIVATDAHPPVLERARSACYQAGSLKHLPKGWVAKAFEPRGDAWCLREPYRGGVDFRRQDIRQALPGGSFDLILCRNLVLTYFDLDLQRTTLARILPCLRTGGAFVIGRRETLPGDDWELVPWEGAEGLGIYRKSPWIAGQDTSPTE